MWFKPHHFCEAFLSTAAHKAFWVQERKEGEKRDCGKEGAEIPQMVIGIWTWFIVFTVVFSIFGKPAFLSTTTGLQALHPGLSCPLKCQPQLTTEFSSWNLPLPHSTFPLPPNPLLIAPIIHYMNIYWVPAMCSINVVTTAVNKMEKNPLPSCILAVTGERKSI